MITAVIFDVDGVLLDSFEANFIFYQDLLKKNGYPAPSREAYAPLFHFNMFDAIEELTGESDGAKVQKMWEIGKSNAIDYPEELANMPDGAKEVLLQLSREYLLGIVTGRVQATIFGTRELAACKKYFKSAVGFEDTVNHKPHPEPLLLCAKRLGVTPERCVYIGDVEHNAIAGHAAGMKVIAYTNNAIPGADAQTATFTEIPNIIRALNA